MAIEAQVNAMSDQIRPALFLVPKPKRSGRSSAGSMLVELKRWLLPGRPAPQNRWVDWVRELAERYGHGPDRRDAAGLVLIRPLRQLRSLRERCFFRTERFFPRINLSVQAVLRASGPTVLVRNGFRGVGPVDHRSQRMELRTPIEPRALGSEAKATSLRMEQWSAGVEFEHLSPVESISPLERVFRRRENAATLMRAKGTSRHVSRLEEIVMRLERQSRRIESSFAASVMTTTLSAKSDVLSARKTTSQARETAEQASRFTGPDAFLRQEGIRDERSEPNQRTHVEAALGPMNVDQITDHVIRQLDRRVVAARERMGKVF